MQQGSDVLYCSTQRGIIQESFTWPEVAIICRPTCQFDVEYAYNISFELNENCSSVTIQTGCFPALRTGAYKLITDYRPSGCGALFLRLVSSLEIMTLMIPSEVRTYNI